MTTIPHRELRNQSSKILERVKNGEVIVRDGKVVKVVQGATHVARPEYDRAIEKPLKDYFDRYHTIAMENFRLSDEEIVDGGRGKIIVQPTRARVS